MKKHTEKPPIDDLFARKLDNMSLSPSADAFERLQARLNQREPETRRVFWRNPVMYRYAAAAACLLLVCLFGSLYWLSSSPEGTPDRTVATNEQVNLTRQKQAVTANAPIDAGSTTGEIASRSTEMNLERLIKTDRVAISKNSGKGSNSSSRPTQLATDAAIAPADAPTLANAKINDKPEVSAPVATPSLDQVAQQITKPALATERVLVVTIAEPATLVATRQAAAQPDNEQPVIAHIDQDSKDDKPTKLNNLWQQMKRAKQGEVFARRDNGDNERGLLNRAYSGLRQSLDKDKSAKP